MKTPAFVILYLIVMIFTYFWRFAGFGAVVDENATAESIKDAASVTNWLLFFNYVLLVVIAYFRGKKIDKKYLAALPVIGGLFDLVLAFIPFVPTIMNILALVLGLSDNKPQVVYVKEQKDSK